MTPYPEAWHEAGHAVIAHCLGGEVQQLSLEPDEAGRGGEASVRWVGMTASERLRCTVAVALAGPLAELQLRDEGALEDDALLLSLRRAWGADWAEAEAGLARLERDPERREELLQGLLADVRELLSRGDVQERVLRVADMLDAHGTLDAALFEETL